MVHIFRLIDSKQEDASIRLTDYQFHRFLLSIVIKVCYKRSELVAIADVLRPSREDGGITHDLSHVSFFMKESSNCYF